MNTCTSFCESLHYKVEPQTWEMCGGLKVVHTFLFVFTLEMPIWTCSTHAQYKAWCQLWIREVCTHSFDLHLLINLEHDLSSLNWLLIINAEQMWGVIKVTKGMCQWKCKHICFTPFTCPSGAKQRFRENVQNVQHLFYNRLSVTKFSEFLSQICLVRAAGISPKQVCLKLKNKGSSLLLKGETCFSCTIVMGANVRTKQNRNSTENIALFGAFTVMGDTVKGQEDSD